MAEGDSVFSFVKEGEYELILGNSLGNKRKEQEYAFHTVRYDFKPASVDSTKPGSLTVGDKNNVTIEVPNIQDSGSTVYNGSKRQGQKEFLLIIDKKSQTFTLERIGSNMQVKKIRSSGSSKAAKVGQPPSSISSATTKTKNRNIKKAKSPSVKEPVPVAPAASSSQETNKIEEQDSDSSSSSDNSSSDSEDDNKNDDDDDDDDDDDIDDKHVEQLNSILHSLGPEPYKKPPEFNQLYTVKKASLSISVVMSPLLERNQAAQDLHLSESGSDSD